MTYPALPEGTPEELRFDVVLPPTAHPSVTIDVYRHRLLNIPRHKLFQENKYRLDRYLPASGMLSTVLNQLEADGVAHFSTLIPSWRETTYGASCYDGWVDFFKLTDSVKGLSLPGRNPALTPEEQTDKLVAEGAPLAWLLANECLQGMPR